MNCSRFLTILFSSAFFIAHCVGTAVTAGEENPQETQNEPAQKIPESELLKLKLVYPREGARMSAVKSSFVYGSVSPANATLWVNQTTVAVYETGSFIAMIPFSPGEFKIKVQAKLNRESAEMIRTVYVASPSAPLPLEPLTISTESLQPSTDMRLTAGDVIRLSFKGSPNCLAEYRFKNLSNKRRGNVWIPLPEKKFPHAGLYEGSAVLFALDRADDASVEYRITDESGKRVKAASPARITITDGEYFSLSEVDVEEAILRTGPSIGSEMMGYNLFLPRGVKLKISGQIGNEVRLKLSDAESCWTDMKNLKPLPENSAIPSIIFESIKISGTERGFIISSELKDKVPYRPALSSDLKLFSLTLFYAVSNIDRIRYDDHEGGAWLEKIVWSQASKDSVQLQFKLKEKLWGYDMRYEENKLVCEFIFSPAIKSRGTPLKDLTVAVDPGHSNDEGSGGTISPQGILEGEVNFRLASSLKEKLEEAGAKVILTRKENESIELANRGRKAWQLRADIFISLHANALPDGSNPFERHGFSIFYFQPQSYSFGKEVHSAYKKNIKIPDDGFYYGNLAVCRPTQMPAILTESAYLIYPPEEALLLSHKFQSLCAETIVEGTERFVNSFGDK